MKKSVLKLFMLYKQFHVIMENVLTIKPENFIHHVFVSQLKWFIFILLFINILDALADTIKNCIRQLHDLSNYTARYYCGFTLMKYCAVHLGLDGYPLKFDAWNESMVFQKIWMKVFYFLFIIYFVLTLWWWIEKEKKIQIFNVAISCSDYFISQFSILTKTYCVGVILFLTVIIEEYRFLPSCRANDILFLNKEIIVKYVHSLKL
jgi:hypothetical protein